MPFLLLPFLALLAAIIRGGILCVPLMIVLHFLHGFIPAVPQLGWLACWLLIAALTLIIPVSED